MWGKKSVTYIPAEVETGIAEAGGELDVVAGVVLDVEGPTTTS